MICTRNWWQDCHVVLIFWILSLIKWSRILLWGQNNLFSIDRWLYFLLLEFFYVIFYDFSFGLYENDRDNYGDIGEKVLSSTHKSRKKKKHLGRFFLYEKLRMLTIQEAFWNFILFFSTNDADHFSYLHNYCDRRKLWSIDNWDRSIKMNVSKLRMKFELKKGKYEITQWKFLILFMCLQIESFLKW